MNDLYGVLRKPIITERGTDLNMKYNKVVFAVGQFANKRIIKKAVERLFKVNVTKVNTANQNGKVKRTGKKLGKRADWKKAVVTLKQGDSIELLEGF